MQTTVKAPITDPPNKNTHTIAGFIGHVPESQFFQLLQTENLIETRSQEELHVLREAAVAHQIHLVAHPSLTIYETPLPEAFASYEQEVRQRPSYKRYHESYRFCLVPVQELITLQWYINLDYIDALKQRVPQPGELREAFDFVYDEGRVPLEGPCASNFSGLPSLAFRGSPYHDLASSFQPFEVRHLNSQKFLLTVHTEIEIKPNYLQLVKVGTRYIIINGVHRALTLLQAGWQQIPCLVRDVPPTIHSLTELGFQQNPGLLPDELILRAERPVYLSDYLDPIIAPHFLQRNVNALWQVIPQVLLNKQITP